MLSPSEGRAPAFGIFSYYTARRSVFQLVMAQNAAQRQNFVSGLFFLAGA